MKVVRPPKVDEKDLVLIQKGINFDGDYPLGALLKPIGWTVLLLIIIMFSMWIGSKL